VAEATDGFAQADGQLSDGLQAFDGLGREAIAVGQQ
jgi:hypothetical protein